MTAILKREFKAYFYSPLGYIFVFFFMLLNAYFFTLGPLYNQVADIKGMFGNTNVMLLFLVPVLTMRLFSEEKNKKTDQLLFTSPVSLTGVVLGKYLAALAVFAIALVLSFIFPAVLFIFGKPPVGEVFGAYIGFICLWSAFIAIGIFLSALTESQVVAAISTFGILLLLYILDWLVSVVPQGLGNVISWFSLLKRYNDFMTGLLNLTNVIYYISFVVVFLFLTVRTLDKSRYS